MEISWGEKLEQIHRIVFDYTGNLGLRQLLARYARLNAKAQEVFEGDEEAARTWLHTPPPGLGNVVPLEFARTTVGYREVEKLLTRIDLGVYA